MKGIAKDAGTVATVALNIAIMAKINDGDVHDIFAIERDKLYGFRQGVFEHENCPLLIQLGRSSTASNANFKTVLDFMKILF
ncbi:hypothetical protein AM1_A0333 (plasmid) [Acaryochloris marina MBIC11017]|uniref:Uncharacterized protein n=1 Tax=Acaryochloris marina (strain MBIC 11017) TaxID=329726 RepID=A8ZKY3_ACAM1|nr:hypothetical protein AM1_A0333 [Acaryochloris marina MBIC11017]